MASTKTTGIPKRFLPLLEQVKTEAGLRYGAQEAAFGTLLGQLARDRDRQLMAQKTAQQSLLGSMQASDTNVNRYYSDAGLSPTVLSSLAGTPSGSRLAGEMAGYRSANQQALLGAQAGGQYQQQRINQEFGDQLGALNSQVTAEQKERGLFTQSALSQLISSDRATRHAANEAARKQQHDDLQAQLDRDTSTSNTALGQGYAAQVNKDGSVSLVPIPGGKADPDNPKNKPKRTTGPGTASPEAQREAGTSFSKAVALARGMVGSQAHTPDVQKAISGVLANGRPAATGKVVYEEVPILDRAGKPTGKTKRQPKLDPDTGQQVTTSSRPSIPAFDTPIANAATEQALYGYVTTATVRALQKLGYSVNQIPGLKTENQYRAANPPKDFTLPMNNRRGTAKSRDQQPG